MNKKKIAFCFSGQARTLDFTYQYFENKVFKPAREQGFEYDIFCAVEDDKDYGKIEEYLKPIKIKKIKTSEVAKDIEKRYGKFIKKNQGKKFYFYHTRRYPIENGLQQWYKIYEVNKLKSEYEKEQGFKYDIVVRLRFDLIFINKINFINVLENIGNGIFINKSDNLSFIRDNFAIGNSTNMDKYSNLYYNFYDVIINNSSNIGLFERFIFYILGIFYKLQFFSFLNRIFETIINRVIVGIFSKKTNMFTYERYMYYNIMYYNIDILYTYLNYNIYRGENNLFWKKIYDISDYEF